MFFRFSPENKRNINPYHYLPFGHGPRNCIGMRFALIEAKSTLVKLIHKFRFEKTEETEVRLFTILFCVAKELLKRLNEYSAEDLLYRV